MSQEECTRLRESVPYVKVYRYNPKHLYPKLSGYEDNGQRKVGVFLRFQILQPAQLICHARVLMSLRQECSVNRACVTVSCLHGFARMPFVFSHVEYCDMHFVYGFCDGNARAAVEEYQRRFPDRRIPSRGVFTRINQTLRDTGCLPSVAVRSEREVV